MLTRKVQCLGTTFDSKDGCRRFFSLSDLTYRQTIWYCSSGDYWNDGEGQFKCPGCGTINRLYERPAIKKLKRYFGKVEEVKT